MSAPREETTAEWPPAMARMALERRWMPWRWKVTVDSQGIARRTKVPLICATGDDGGSSTDSTKWGTYDEAIYWFHMGHAEGVGYSLHGEPETVAVDCDHCRDPVTGVLADWAAALVAAAGTYCEVTPSREGIRIIGRTDGKLESANTQVGVPAGADGKAGHAEVYFNAGRYITVSFQALEGTWNLAADIDGIAQGLLDNDTGGGRRPSDKRSVEAGTGMEDDERELTWPMGPRETEALAVLISRMPNRRPPFVRREWVKLAYGLRATFPDAAHPGLAESLFMSHAERLEEGGWSLEEAEKAWRTTLDKPKTGTGTLIMWAQDLGMTAELRAYRSARDDDRVLERFRASGPLPDPGNGAGSADLSRSVDQGDNHALGHGQELPARHALGWEPIRVRAGKMDLAADEGLDALTSSPWLGAMQRGGMPVEACEYETTASDGRTTTSAGLRRITPVRMRYLLPKAVGWESWSVLKKDWIPCDVPKDVADMILGMAGSRLPAVSGIITTPTLRPDGSVLTEPGWDRTTKLYHAVNGDLALRMPPAPTRADALAALEELLGLIAEFPFPTGPRGIDASVALSAIMTCVTRGAYQTAPMHVFNATQSGTGKSYLADIASAIATGRWCPAVSLSKGDEEMEKRLGGLLMRGSPILSLDNINGILQGEMLCQAIERPLVEIRQLGSSDIHEVENRATILANGNGIRPKADLVRRSLKGMLDSGMERPWARRFSRDPVREVLADRGRWIGACLTVVRAWLAERGKGSTVVDPLASFEGWSGTVRSTLMWVGLPDPCLTTETLRMDDPEADVLRTVLRGWAADPELGIGREALARRLAEVVQSKMMSVAASGWTSATAADVVDMRTAMLDAMLSVAGDRGQLSARRLSLWLSSKEGTIADGMRFERGSETRLGQRWTVKKING